VDLKNFLRTSFLTTFSFRKPIACLKTGKLPISIHLEETYNKHDNCVEYFDFELFHEESTCQRSFDLMLLFTVRQTIDNECELQAISTDI
jgi:hypothetical protein